MDFDIYTWALYQVVVEVFTYHIILNIINEITLKFFLNGHSSSQPVPASQGKTSVYIDFYTYPIIEQFI